MEKLEPLPLIDQEQCDVARIEYDHWQKELADAVRDPYELCDILQLNSETRHKVDLFSRQFPLLVTRSFLSRMQPGNPNDPLLLQVLPLKSELETVAGFDHDPVGEFDKNNLGIIKKYNGRVLLVVTSVCAIHCRYCFRRSFPYEVSAKSHDQWEEAVESIRNDPTINEVICSGGDPLTLSDNKLDRLIQLLETIDHVQTLRIHTRLPIVLPSRVTDRFVKVLQQSRFNIVIVIHSNHANELDEHCRRSINKLQTVTPLLFNQAVLLKHINNSLDAQLALSNRLIELGVKPYYLHQLDRVTGAAHWEVPLEEGKQLIRQLRKELSGYAIPQYVQEIAGMPHKIPIE